MIGKETIAFLKQLKTNNNREWFKINKTTYDEMNKGFGEFIDALLLEIAGFDPRLSGVKSKDCIFRIYRDVRFSKDKSPYKPNFGAAMAKGGRKAFLGGYYFHLEPGNKSFLAGGCYMPDSATLKKIRQEIDYCTEEFKRILGNKKFISLFGGLSDTYKLKLAPKGYPKDHPEIELLKHKSYVVAQNITDKEIVANNFLKQAVSSYKTMKPLNDFLIRAVS